MIKASEKAFLSRKDKFFFHRIEKKYQKNLLHFFVANMVEDPKRWIGHMNERTYLEWKKRFESLSYHLEQQLRDIQEIIETKETTFVSLLEPEGGHPELFRRHLSGKTSLETMALLHKASGYLKYWNREMDGDPVWEEKSILIKKYEPFLNMEKDKIKCVIEKVLK